MRTSKQIIEELLSPHPNLLKFFFKDENNMNPEALECGYLSSGEQALIRLAADIWQGRGLLDRLRVLDSNNKVLAAKAICQYLSK